MKKIIILTMLILMVILINSSCTKKIVYSVPTQDEVNKFIEEEALNVLSIKEAEEFTIILFQNGLEYGHYTLYKDQNNKLHNKGVKSSSRGDNPISTGGAASVKEPFVTVIINDEAILQNADYIEVTFDDGNTVKEKVEGKGVILIHINKNNYVISYIKLAIYDKDANLLYEN